MTPPRNRRQPEPALLRFRALVEQKYVSGLTAAETAELQQLEAGFSAQDESFYGTIPALPRFRREPQ